MACMAWQQAAGTGPHQMRRRSAAAALLAAGLGAVLPGPAQAATVLRVLAWPGYADADFVAVFEKRHGVKVEITTVASDDILRAKLASPSGPGFDLVAANTAEIAQAAKKPHRALAHRPARGLLRCAHAGWPVAVHARRRGALPRDPRSRGPKPPRRTDRTQLMAHRRIFAQRRRDSGALLSHIC